MACKLTQSRLRHIGNTFRIMAIDPTLLGRVSLGDGSAAADLAQLIWDGAIEDEHVLALLRSEDDQIRGAVAWAVWDAGRPPAALSYLIETGISDPADAVRVYALAAVTDYTGMSHEQVTGYLAPYASDPSPRIRHFVQITVSSPQPPRFRPKSGVSSSSPYTDTGSNSTPPAE
jgi:hypothetical protein